MKKGKGQLQPEHHRQEQKPNQAIGGRGRTQHPTMVRVREDLHLWRGLRWIRRDGIDQNVRRTGNGI